MFIIFLFDSSMKICILNWVLSRQDIFNSLMNKNNPFEASTVVHNREQKRPERFKNRLFYVQVGHGFALH